MQISCFLLHLCFRLIICNLLSVSEITPPSLASLLCCPKVWSDFLNPISCTHCIPLHRGKYRTTNGQYIPSCIALLLTVKIYDGIFRSRGPRRRGGGVILDTTIVFVRGDSHELIHWLLVRLQWDKRVLGQWVSLTCVHRASGSLCF